MDQSVIQASKQASKNGSQSIQWTTPNQDKIHLSKNKIDVVQVRTTHLGKVTLGIGEGQRPDYKAMEKALAPSFVHSYDAAVLKSSFQDWVQPIALIHDCLKVLPNDMDRHELFTLGSEIEIADLYL